MKTTAKILAALLAFGLAAAPALRAAEGDAPAKKAGPRAGQRLEKMTEARDKELTEKLKLTAEQRAKLTELRKAGAEQIKAAAGDRAKLREFAKAQHDEVRAILTPEQQKEFDAMPVAGPRGKGGKAKKGA